MSVRFAAGAPWAANVAVKVATTVFNLETLLTAYWQEGGLGGSTPDEAFEVRCDRSTMTQADLDAGRLVAKVTVLPVAAIERITIVLALSSAGQVVDDRRRDPEDETACM